MVSITIDLTQATQIIYGQPDWDEFVPGVNFGSDFAVDFRAAGGWFYVAIDDPTYHYPYDRLGFRDWSLEGTSSALMMGWEGSSRGLSLYFEFPGTAAPPEPSDYLQAAYTDSDAFELDSGAFYAAYAAWRSDFGATAITEYYIYAVDPQSIEYPYDSVPVYSDLLKIGTVTLSTSVRIEDLYDYVGNLYTPAYFEAFTIVGSEFGDRLLAPSRAGTVIYGNDGSDEISLAGRMDENHIPLGSTGAEAHGGMGNDLIEVRHYWSPEIDPRFGVRLFGDEGSDILIGARGDDRLCGGADDDGLYGKGGDDVLDGGDGDDFLDGGEGADTAIFSGKFADYEIGPVGYHDFDTFTVAQALALRSSTQAIKVKGVEYLQFDDVTVSVADLTYKSSADLFAQYGKLGFMATLASAAYRLLPSDPSKGIVGEVVRPYANDPDTQTNRDAYAFARANLTLLNWADFPELKPASSANADFPVIGIRDGTFLAGNAAALVGRSSDALFVAFRGTNDVGGGLIFDTPDTAQWLDMPGHYVLMYEFVRIIGWYLVNNPDVKTVYLTGHSLGAAMVQPAIATIEGYLASHYPGVHVALEAVTFATPGYTNDLDGDDSRITNFWTDNDIIQIPTLTKVVDGDRNSFIDGIFDGPVNVSSHSMDLYLAIATFLNGEGIDVAETKSLNGINYKNFVMKVTEQSGRFFVGVGADTLTGTAPFGDDAMFGGLSADKLNGGGGRDSLFGGSGSDVLNGGTGKDYLEGGRGADLFLFSNAVHSKRGAERDVILDFNRAEGDRIQLSLIDADTRAPRGGNQKFVFIGSDTFAHYHKVHPKVFGMIRWADGVLQGNTDSTFAKAEFEIEVHMATGGMIRSADLYL